MDFKQKSMSTKETKKQLRAQKSLTNDELVQRVKKLTESITYESYQYVRLGLFEKHKVIFTSYLALKIMEKDGLIKQEEINHFV